METVKKTRMACRHRDAVAGLVVLAALATLLGLGQQRVRNALVDKLAAQLDPASPQLADLNRRLRESAEAEVVLREDMAAMRKQLHEERR